MGICGIDEGALGQLSRITSSYCTPIGLKFPKLVRWGMLGATEWCVPE
jgi:hypothetical protein